MDFLKTHPELEESLKVPKEYSLIKTNEWEFFLKTILANPLLTMLFQQIAGTFYIDPSSLPPDRYVCKECGKVANMDNDGVITRTCEHTGTIVLDLHVRVFGESKLKEVKDK